jgi:hypothetical protein
MPIEVEIGDTGQIVEFPDGTAPETMQQALKRFSEKQAPTQEPVPRGTPEEERPSFPGAGIAEPAATLATGIVAEPVAGIAGLAASVAPTRPASVFGEAFGEPEEIGPSGPEVGAEAVKATREALTYKPKTEAGAKGLEAVGRVLEPVGKVLQAAESYLGDETFEATGSPALAAAATTIPTVIIEALGLAATKGMLKGAKRTKQLARDKAAMKAVVESAPDIEQIKNASRAVYSELDSSGVTITPGAFKGLNSKITTEIKKAGFRKKLAPKTAAVLDEFAADAKIGKAPTLTEIDELRKVAQGAASALEPNEARLGGIIIETIDTFLDEAKPSVFIKGAAKPSEIIPKFRVARELWGRARRSELINEAFEKAKNQASGFENGIVTQFRSILNNKKKARFFKPEEVAVMKEVVRGTTPANMAKMVGRLGFSEGHATNVLGGLAGAAGGAAVFGAPGAVAVPLIGQVSRKLAQKLTRAGASAYIAKVPRSQRTAAELSELLARPDIALDKLMISHSPLIKEAAEIAKGRRMLATAGVYGAAGGAVKEMQPER